MAQSGIPIEFRKNIKGFVYRFYTFVVCLAWEVNTPQAKICAKLDEVLGRSRLSEKERWLLELYDERPVSYQEEKSITQLLTQYATRRAYAEEIISFILSLFPEEKKGVAQQNVLTRHFLTDYQRSRGSPWLRRPRGNLMEDKAVERETAFERFLSIPGFETAFRDYYRRPPKNRTNCETRVLILVAAIMRCVAGVDAIDNRHRLDDILKGECYVTDETLDAVFRILPNLSPDAIDPTFIQHDFVADARDKDVINFSKLVRVLSRSYAISPEAKVFCDTFLDMVSLRNNSG